MPKTKNMVWVNCILLDSSEKDHIGVNESNEVGEQSGFLSNFMRKFHKT